MHILLIKLKEKQISWTQVPVILNYNNTQICATVYYPLSETKMLTICVIKQIIVTHLLGYNCIANHFSFFDQTLEQFDTRDKKCPAS